MALLGAALYGVLLFVWLRYSEEIASRGGLAAFVEAAVGRRVALAQAAIWAFSYFLYLPYTVTDLVYEDVPRVLPGLHAWRPLCSWLQARRGWSGRVGTTGNCAPRGLRQRR